MIRSFSTFVIILLLTQPLFAQNIPGEASPVNPGGDSSLQTQQSSSQDKEAPEEPDFAFIAGGPYTQPQGSYQVIMAGQSGTLNSVQNGTTRKTTLYGTLFRNEWGLTDRWELDLISPGGGERDTVNGIRTLSSFAEGDSVIGIRYRVLKEGDFPFTLTAGPQIILPTGSVASGTSVGKTGYAWDLSTAKDWNGPVFIYNSLNFAFFPSVANAGGGSPRRFNLQNLTFGSALGIRALEADRGAGIHHDLHCFIEYGLTRTESFAGAVGKTAQISMVVAPGIRYGFMKKYTNGVERHLMEVGASLPVGLNNQTPRFGLILQVQFEHILEKWAAPK